MQQLTHPRRPRGSQSGRKKRRDESFQSRAKKLLGTYSHRTICKTSSGCRLLIGHKKCFVLLCPIDEQFLLSSFPEFVHDGYLSGSFTKLVRARETFIFYFPNQKRNFNYRLFCPYLKTFVPCHPTRLTASGSPRMCKLEPCSKTIGIHRLLNYNHHKYSMNAPFDGAFALKSAL